MRSLSTYFQNSQIQKNSKSSLCASIKASLKGLFYMREVGEKDAGLTIVIFESFKGIKRRIGCGSWDKAMADPQAIGPSFEWAEEKDI